MIEELVDLHLSQGDWALFGSGPMLLRGWIDEIGDVDVLVREAALEIATSLGILETLGDGNEIIRIGDGLTFLQTWPFGPAYVNTMIDTAEMIQDIPWVQLEHIVAYLEMSDRPKDRDRLAIIEAHR